MKNVTAYLTEPQKFEIRDSEMPFVGDDDVLIEVKTVGICGSDLGFFVDPTSHGYRTVEYPIVLGHEAAGIVAAVGKNVKNFKEGDTVCVEPGVPCGKCSWCKSGQYNMCPDLWFLAAPPFERGAFSRYISHPADFTFKLPDGMSTTQGALLEPLAIGLYAAKRANVRFGDTVAILGAGSVGLMTLMAAKASGAREITITDLCENHLDMAKMLGADNLINLTSMDLEEKAAEITGGFGFDYVFEAVGIPSTLKSALQIVKKGGKIIEVGLNHDPVPFDFYTAARKQCDLLSIWRYVNMYPTAIGAVSSGKIDPESIVTDRFSFNDIQQAFEKSLKDKQNVVKAVIEF